MTTETYLKWCEEQNITRGQLSSGFVSEIGRHQQYLEHYNNESRGKQRPNIELEDLSSLNPPDSRSRADSIRFYNQTLADDDRAIRNARNAIAGHSGGISKKRRK